MKYVTILFAAMVLSLALAAFTDKKSYPKDSPLYCPNVTNRSTVPTSPEEQKSFESVKFKAQIAAISNQIPLNTVARDIFGRTLRPCPPSCEE
jgi:hypothetical protein